MLSRLLRTPPTRLRTPAVRRLISSMFLQIMLPHAVRSAYTIAGVRESTGGPFPLFDGELEMLPKCLTLKDPKVLALLPSQPIQNVEYLWLSGMGDMSAHDAPTFPNVHSLWLSRCDKNFVYYWGNPVIFPALRTVYLDTHAGDFGRYTEFQKQTTFYATEGKIHGARYRGLSNVKLKPKSEMVLEYARIRDKCIAENVHYYDQYMDENDDNNNYFAITKDELHKYSFLNLPYTKDRPAH